jgi:hypothetical protein
MAGLKQRGRRAATWQAGDYMAGRQLHGRPGYMAGQDTWQARIHGRPGATWQAAVWQQHGMRATEVGTRNFFF